jgi:N-acetyl-alpha-D-muramate 1-phosphate uridylyltransferase
MKAMILAAGHGKRMLPLTQSTPKPLLRAGEHSLIEWQILKLARAGIGDLVINLHHLGEQIPAALGDGARLGVHIQYSPETELLETAGGIINALPLLGTEAFVVVNGDVWTDYDYTRLNAAAARLEADHALAHLLLVPNAEHHPQGDFYLHGNGYVAGEGEPRLTFSGISVLHPLLFQGLTVQRLPLSPVLRQAMTRQQVSGEYFTGDWQDIGSPERLKALECRLRNPQPATL